MLDFKHVHFVGVGGIGMSGLARVLLQMGYRVSGSDLSATRITEDLRNMGAAIFYGHKRENLPEGVEAVVASSAIPDNNPEIVEAKRRGLMIMARGHLLSLLMNPQRGVAIAGTHGKTTTSAIISHILKEAEFDPTFIVGGVLKAMGTNAKLGGSDYLVAEADESDASFVELRPLAAVVTSIDGDVNLSSGAFNDCHNDYEEVLIKIRRLFLQFINGVKEGGFAVLCGDHEGVRAVLPQVKSRAYTYGLSENNDFRAVDIEYADYKSAFTVVKNGAALGRVRLPLPGSHNVQNALAAIAISLGLGIPFASAAAALESFSGVGRRFEVVSRAKGIIIVDDYAHNPEKIKAALNSAHTGGAKRVVAVFQPHRFSRTEFLLDQFPSVFSQADILLVTDIYSAGEEPIEGVTSEKLVEKILNLDSHPQRVAYIPDAEGIVNFVAEECQAGDIVIFLGAGDICKCARRCAERLGY